MTFYSGGLKPVGFFLKMKIRSFAFFRHSDIHDRYWNEFRIDHISVENPIFVKRLFFLSKTIGLNIAFEPLPQISGILIMGFRRYLSKILMRNIILLKIQKKNRFRFREGSTLG